MTFEECHASGMTAQEAANVLGISRGAVYDRARVRGVKMRRQRMQVIWRGKVYESTSAVAEAAGVKESTVKFHLYRHGHLDRLGVGKSRKGCKPGLYRSIPVKVGNRAWPSIAELARYLEMDRSNLRRMLVRGDYDGVMLRVMRKGAA